VLGIEDMASYNDFFAPDEWTSVVAGDRLPVPEEDWRTAIDSARVSSGVTISGPESAARSNQAAPENSQAVRNSNHSVAIIERGTSRECGYDLECKTCGHLVVSDTLVQAQAIARLHEFRRNILDQIKSGS
jgi:hypothetical protein